MAGLELHIFSVGAKEWLLHWEDYSLRALDKVLLVVHVRSRQVSSVVYFRSVS